nr:type II toxin-antitoxin system HicA family toxin [Gloeomargarita lithophora]
MTTIHFQGISYVQRHPLTLKYHYLVRNIDARLKECGVMPKKIRELKQLLRKAGFEELPGKGSHTNWIHPLYPGKITVFGKDGADAKSY